MTESKLYEERNGDLRWYSVATGKYHREDDKPAIITHLGAKFWYQEGLLHREGDKPAAIYSNGEKEWYKNDLLHRLDGPAVVRCLGESCYCIDYMFGIK